MLSWDDETSAPTAPPMPLNDAEPAAPAEAVAKRVHADDKRIINGKTG